MAKKKSNDKIPADEMLLAEAIAAAESAGLTGCAGAPFLHDVEGRLIKCCAVGALALIATRDVRHAAANPYNSASKLLNHIGLRRWFTDRIYIGNDRVDEPAALARGGGNHVRVAQ